MIKFNDTIYDLSNINDLKGKIPELNNLDCIENNSWHENISVWEHTVNVLNYLEEILTLDKLNTYSSELIDKNSRKDILFISSLFHDIAKCDVLSYEEGFGTTCPGHEEKGAKKVKNILQKFNLSKKEKELVIFLIKNHGHIHYLLDINNKNLNKDLSNYKEKYNNNYIDLIIMALTDTLGSELYLSNKNDYDFRINFYWTELNNILNK